MSGLATSWSAERVEAAVTRRARRATVFAAAARRWRHVPPSDKRAAFVMGCQRSGTSMLIETLAVAPEIITYGEGTNLALRNYRLRDANRVAQVIHAGPAPLSAMKPICDAQLTDVLLDQHHGSKAIWIYRDHRDVVRSALAKWGDDQLELVRNLQQGRYVELGWRGERIAPTTLAAVQATEVRTPADGAGLVWWMRNRLPFDLGLVDDPRVLLVSYEQLVSEPAAQLDRVFGFLGVTAPPDAVGRLSARSVTRRPVDGLSNEIEALAVDLAGHLEAARVDAVAAGR